MQMATPRRLASSPSAQITFGKALGGPADDIDVHLVQTHLHRAAQTGGAELQRAVEPALDLLVVVRDGPQLGTLLVRDGRGCRPTSHIPVGSSYAFTSFRTLFVVVGNGLRLQNLLGLLAARRRDIQPRAVAGKAVDDLSRAAVEVVILEAGDPVGREQGNRSCRNRRRNRSCSSGARPFPSARCRQPATAGRPGRKPM